MALDLPTIRKRLAAASRTARDDEARDIIDGASTAELAGLDPTAVLMLYEALRMLPPLVYSADDQAAMKKLAAASQFQMPKTPEFGVQLVKNARLAHPQIQRELTPDLVTRIYAAEKKRLSWYESAGFDGETIGRGQLGQPAYDDVRSPKHFAAELERCLTHAYVARIVNAAPRQAAKESWLFDGSYSFKVPPTYSMVVNDPVIEDFVVAAYLAIRIEAASKAGRSFKDTARFAVALYHGMRSMVVAAQTAAKNDVDWAPVETLLRSQGHADECDYVGEVVK